MKWEKLRDYLSIFKFERNSELDVFAFVDDYDRMIGECWTKKFENYHADVLIFDFDSAPPACKFLIKDSRGDAIEMTTEAETIAREFIIHDCNKHINLIYKHY
jgi:hypothetical protein